LDQCTIITDTERGTRLTPWALAEETSDEIKLAHRHGL